MPDIPNPLTNVDDADQQFTTTVELNEGTVLVEFIGELDYTVEAAAVETVRRAASGVGIAAIELDLSGLTFIDSSGVRCLLRAHAAASEHDLDFIVSVADNQIVPRILSLCGLSDYYLGRDEDVG